MRLIDADKLIEKAYWHGDTPSFGKLYPEGHDAVDVEDIENTPTVDAVQVVRCKDCKHGRACYGVGMSSIVCEFSNYMNSPNGFCHEGKRKDE